MQQRYWTFCTKKGCFTFLILWHSSRCEDSWIEPSWISWLIFLCYSFSITILPIFHRNRLFQICLLYVRLKFHFSPFNVMFLGLFFKTQELKMKIKMTFFLLFFLLITTNSKSFRYSFLKNIRISTTMYCSKQSNIICCITH